MFITQTFYAYSESTFHIWTYRDDAFFDFTGIKVPVMIQYSLISGRIVPYFNGGVSFLGIIRKKYLHIRETETYLSHEINTSDDSDLTFYPGEIAGLLGAGIKIKITGNLKLNLQGRIELGHGLFKSGAESREYSQYSLQPTILLGVSF